MELKCIQIKSSNTRALAAHEREQRANQRTNYASFETCSDNLKSKQAALSS
jgi:hypothetical protein